MESGHLKLKFKMKRDKSWEQNSGARQSPNSVEPERTGQRNNNLNSFIPTTPQNPIDLSGENDSETEDEPSSNMQLVLYQPPPGEDSGDVVPALNRSEAPPIRRHSFPGQPPRVLPAVGAFTVQCANCFKWRLIPTKEKYEEIREHILVRPFLCETAREWRPSVSCDAEPDIEQDSSRLWAIDKPSIAQPPPGWQRLLRIRGEGSTKFADVYYQSPTGKRLRSMVEIQKYLEQHPEYTDAGVNMLQFSFQIPRPLQDNYVRKRPHRPANFLEDGGSGRSHRFNDSSEVPPLSWSAAEDDTDLRLGVSEPPQSTFHETLVSGFGKESGKRKKTSSNKKRYDGLDDGTSQVNLEDTLRL